MRGKTLLLTFFAAAAIPILGGCGKDRDYDLENLNKEITLFGEEFSIPIGNVGPITVQNTLGGTLGGFLKEGDDGLLYVESEQNIFTISAYEIATKVFDPSTTVVWNAGYQSTIISGAAFIFRLLGVKFPNQKISISVENPLNIAVRTSATVRTICTDFNFNDTYSGEVPIDDVRVPRKDEVTLADISLPEEVIDGMSSVVLDDLTLSLPAGWYSSIPENSNTHFTYSYKFRSNIALAGTFSFEATLPIRSITLAIGKFNLTRADVSFDIVNTLPLDLTITSLKFLKKDSEEAEADENVVIDQSIRIAPGTLGSPAVTPVTFHIEALQGTIPDINGLEVGVSMKTPDKTQASPLSSNQGLSVKSATAKITGGVTIDLDKTKKGEGK